MQVMNIALATDKDVILFFSYSGSTKDMEDIMRIAKERRVSVILITHFPNSRATEYADVVLLCVFCKRNPEVYSKARSSTVEAIMPKLL